jgi:cellobionic acid phosphorylase
MLKPTPDGERYELLTPTAMPRAAGFLWNQRMMICATCRGYAVAQFMQPEPAKYVYAPNLEAKTFMQPEQPYYAHHPGRFFYVKDEETGDLFSAPYEPVRAAYEYCCFSVGKSDLRWTLQSFGIEIKLTLSLSVDDVVELWDLSIINRSGRARRISVYPYFPIGYMSWMNQSAEYRADLGGVVATCVTPYQKVADHFKNKFFKDKTFFLHQHTPASWEAKQEIFEGEGGLHNPSGLQSETLSNNDARYETPAAVLQYRLALPADGEQRYRFIFGAAFDDAEIKKKRDTYLSVEGLNAEGFDQARADYTSYIASGSGCLTIKTPDAELDNFFNHWLPRQMFYHGDVNRLTTDPQTRNYLQDNMGMTFIKPQVTRAAFLHALSQQENSGAMPDGILLTDTAELKYINQVPHTDHCVWLPVCLKTYLDETNDYAILNELVTSHDNKTLTVFERITQAMDWLLHARDHRGLSFIAQGDWCDPMNMVGYKGKGVSGWLSVATAYALHLWADVCEKMSRTDLQEKCMRGAQEINTAVNHYLWDGNWFGRGITDDDVVFGISKDKEGRIFLNPQSWAILGGAANPEQCKKMIAAIEEQLATPYGVTMLAPAYTAMRDDVGRVTQKHPGSAENGSVYNHAAIFYIYSLFTISETDRAYKHLRQMIPGPTEADYLQRGQLPVYIPNYYRGAYHQFPRTAGRSSQLFNTGTVSWFYRCVVEGIFGLQGDAEGLRVNPQLPSHWNEASAVRHFRGACFKVNIRRDSVAQIQLRCDGELLRDNCVRNIQSGREYCLEVLIPQVKTPE